MYLCLQYIRKQSKRTMSNDRSVGDRYHDIIDICLEFGFLKNFLPKQFHKYIYKFSVTKLLIQKEFIATLSQQY